MQFAIIRGGFRMATSLGSSDMKGRGAQTGFTFIELMSVVAIMGILVCIMMPSVKNYFARAKVSEAVLALAQCRTTIGEVYLSGGSLPDANNWGCEANKPSKYVNAITTDEYGTIGVETGSGMGDLRLAPRYITMAPINRSGFVMNEDDKGTAVFRWRCGNTVDGTDLDPTFLPSTCRGL